MQHIGSQQVVNLHGLEQGQFMSIVLTEASSNCVLEFQHVTDDEKWNLYPGFVGMHDDGVIVERMKCISGKMRLRFLSAPTKDYLLSIVWDARPQF